MAGAIAVLLAAAFLTGSGAASSAAASVRGTQRIPAALAAAIHARFGAGAIRSSSAKATPTQPPYALGASVAMSADGTTALVGAPGGFISHGAAYVFHVSDAGSWSSSGTPTAVLRTKNAWGLGAGIALSADGTTAFVGADRTGIGVSSSDAIYVFHASAEDGWASSSTPTATLSGAAGVGSKLAVSADGTTLVAGGFTSSGDALKNAAYVFHTSSESAWVSSSTPTATLTNAGEGTSAIFGPAAVAISGDGMTALLGDYADASGSRAYVFHVAAENAWMTSSTPTAILSDANNAKGYLGYSLALSGDGTVAFLGAPIKPGAVDVYDVAGEDAWVSTSTPTAILTNAAGSKSDLFGVSVAASTDGKTALVGAYFHNKVRGAAAVFHVAHEGDWVSSSAPTARLTDSAGRIDDLLGYAPAISADGTTVLLGAPGVRFTTGAAQVSHVADADSWTSSTSPTGILTVKALDGCVVPFLRGVTVRAAKRALRARSCRLGTVKRVHARGKKGRIVSQSRPESWRMHVGRKVNVKVVK
jgi:hypothetical protein